MINPINPLNSNVISCKTPAFKSGFSQALKNQKTAFKNRKPHLCKMPVVSELIDFAAKLFNKKIHYNEQGKLSRIENDHLL